MPEFLRSPKSRFAKKVDRGYRRNANQRGYDARWREYRKEYLHRHPICCECKEHGRIVEASVVDHIKPHRGNEKLFVDTMNHQPLCKPCHDKKTGRGE